MTQKSHFLISPEIRPFEASGTLYHKSTRARNLDEKDNHFIIGKSPITTPDNSIIVKKSNINTPFKISSQHILNLSQLTEEPAHPKLLRSR